MGIFSHYFYSCKCTSQIAANTLGFVMLFNNLSHLNEIFILLSLLEQSPRFPECSLSSVFEDAPTGRESSLSEAWEPPAEASRGAVGAFLHRGEDWCALVTGSWGCWKPNVEEPGAEYLSWSPRHQAPTLRNGDQHPGSCCWVDGAPAAQELAEAEGRVPPVECS